MIQTYSTFMYFSNKYYKEFDKVVLVLHMFCFHCSLRYKNIDFKKFKKI